MPVPRLGVSVQYIVSSCDSSRFIPALGFPGIGFRIPGFAWSRQMGRLCGQRPLRRLQRVNLGCAKATPNRKTAEALDHSEMSKSNTDECKLPGLVSR